MCRHHAVIGPGRRPFTPRRAIYDGGDDVGDRHPAPGRDGRRRRCGPARPRARRCLGVRRPQRRRPRQRAAAAGLRDVGSIAALAQTCDLIVSVCPPHAASRRSQTPCAGSGASMSTQTRSLRQRRARSARSCAAALRRRRHHRAAPADGGDDPALPLRRGGTGDRRGVRRHRRSTPRVVSERPGDASAVKMTYAAWTKGTAALVLAARAVARAEGVEAQLVQEWALSLPELEAEYARAARSAAAKGWRWIGEMEEIAATFAAAGMPAGFHLAAAEVFRRGSWAPGRDGGAFGEDHAAGDCGLARGRDRRCEEHLAGARAERLERVLVDAVDDAARDRRRRELIALGAADRATGHGRSRPTARRSSRPPGSR